MITYGNTVRLLNDITIDQAFQCLKTELGRPEHEKKRFFFFFFWMPTTDCLIQALVRHLYCRFQAIKAKGCNWINWTLQVPRQLILILMMLALNPLNMPLSLCSNLYMLSPLLLHLKTLIRGLMTQRGINHLWVLHPATHHLWEHQLGRRWGDWTYQGKKWEFQWWEDHIVVGNIVTASQAQRKWYMEVISTVSSGDYKPGVVNFFVFFFFFSFLIIPCIFRILPISLFRIELRIYGLIGGRKDAS